MQVTPDYYVSHICHILLEQASKGCASNLMC